MRAFAIALLLTTGCEAATALGIFETNGAVASATNVVLTTDTGEDVPAVRVRVVLAAKEAVLRVDARSARLATAMGASAPIAANAADPLPLVTLEPRTAKTVDLYFATAGAAPTFTWTVGATQLHTPIALDTSEPQPAGATWWFSPSYAWATYRHQDGPITPRPPHRATIHAAGDDQDSEPPCDQW
ncbi:MAG TPA: hypothetical protein VIV58_27030 [Kofleriaceae bacterium]